MKRILHLPDDPRAVEALDSIEGGLTMSWEVEPHAREPHAAPVTIASFERVYPWGSITGRVGHRPPSRASDGRMQPEHWSVSVTLDRCARCVIPQGTPTGALHWGDATRDGADAALAIARRLTESAERIAAVIAAGSPASCGDD